MHPIRRIAAALLSTFVLVACGGDDTGPADRDTPTIVVTTNILGDVVSSMVGDAAHVVTVMPTGANPHEFQASARQVAAIHEADLLIVNGGGFEEAVLDVIESAEADGVPVHEAVSAVEPLELGPVDHEGHDQDGHEADGHDEHDSAHDDHEGHDHGPDAHFFTDPARMSDAARGILATLLELPGVDRDAVRSRGEAYIAELDALDREIEATLQAIPPAARVLVTNHGVLDHFADRYGFEVAGTVIPSGSTTGVSAADLARLADVMRSRQVRVVFTDASSSDSLARTLADEVGDVAVVELFTESLGDEESGADSYLSMMRINAQRVAEALS